MTKAIVIDGISTDFAALYHSFVESSLDSLERELRVYSPELKETNED